MARIIIGGLWVVVWAFSMTLASVEFIPPANLLGVAENDSTSVPRTRIEMSQWWMDTRLLDMVYVQPEPWGDWRVSWTHLGDDQGIDWTDTTGASMGTLYYGETQWAFSARVVKEEDALRLSIRNISQSAIGSHQWMALDLGWQHELMPDWRVGILIKNIAGTFTQMDTKGYTELGSFYGWGPVELALDYSTRFSAWRGGVVWDLGRVKLKGGLDQDRMLSIGCALEADPIRLDYLWQTLEGMGALHRVAIEWEWP
jgi:hypothetical protein